MANVSTLFTTYRKFWSQIAPMCGQIRYVLRLFLRDKLDKRLWSPFSSHLWSTPNIEVNSFFWARLGWSLYIDIILVLILVFCSLDSLFSSLLSLSFLLFSTSSFQTLSFYFPSHLLTLLSSFLISEISNSLSLLLYLYISFFFPVLLHLQLSLSHSLLSYTYPSPSPFFSLSLLSLYRSFYFNFSPLNCKSFSEVVFIHIFLL